jgi:transcriptional pleiotropic regulator of transition state genes
VTGMARKVDSLGRVVLPAEMRRSLGIRDGDLVDIALDGDNIVLGKVQQCCVFCGTADALSQFSGKLVCERCIAALARDAPPRAS